LLNLGNPIRGSRHKRGAHVTIEDEQLREAQDIFGQDYDPGEFEDGEDEDDEDDEDDYSAERRKKKNRDAKKMTIYDFFEPGDLIEKYYTDFDKFLREEDEPERFITRAVPVDKVKIP